MSGSLPVPFVLWVGIWDGSQAERWNYALHRDIFNMEQFHAIQQRIGALGSCQNGTNLAYFKRGYAPYWSNSQSAGGGTLYVKLMDSSRSSGGWDVICTPLLEAILSSSNGPFKQYDQYITGVMINVTQSAYSRICIWFTNGTSQKIVKSVYLILAQLLNIGNNTSLIHFNQQGGRFSGHYQDALMCCRFLYN